MNSAETLRTRSAELIIAVNTPKTLGLNPAPFKLTKAKTNRRNVNKGLRIVVRNAFGVFSAIMSSADRVR